MRRLAGLYAITSPAICADVRTLLAAVEPVLPWCALVQLRDKSGDRAHTEALARALLDVCRPRGVPLIVNDDPELAARIGADGVHLGSADAAPAAARTLLGADAIVGVTCGDSIERARAAQEAGADYVAFGRLFPSRTKPGAPPAPLDVLGRARAALQVSVCGIGGITPGRAAAVAAAGAQLIAAIDGLFGVPDPGAAARDYVEAISSTTGNRSSETGNLPA